MSTSNPPLSFDEIKSTLNLIGHHLLDVDSPLLPAQTPSADLAYLERLNTLLKQYRQQFLDKSRALYQGLTQHDLQSTEGQTLLATLKTTLNTQLLELDRREQIDGKARKSFMTFEAGFTAQAREAALGATDRLLHPQERAILDRIPLGATLRPGLYALTLQYQGHTVELAGAFVLTEQSGPVVTDLTSVTPVGRVGLFTPSRGIEFFDSLASLDSQLFQRLASPEERRHFMDLLARSYHALTPSAIWPLALTPIQDRPLYEHLDNALIAKRSEDIDRALSLVDNPGNDSQALIDALEQAIRGALPDLTARLQWRAQTLLDRWLRHSAPDWYRSASDARRALLAEYLHRYNEARQNLEQLLGPLATPHALARHQWLERLSDDLEIHDLAPEQLQVSTRRFVSAVGEYTHERNLIELALRGLHPGDEQPGSEFLKKTTLRYAGAALPNTYAELTPAWLVEQLSTLQPRIDFGELQKHLHAKTELRQAIETLFDHRINALAYAAMLQGHLREDDFERIQRLRQGSDPQLSASTLALHEAQLQDLWVLRQRNTHGVVDRVLLCTPQAPREQQFQAFDSEIACQNHILGWALDNGGTPPQGSLTDYLLGRVALRFRAKMNQVLSGLSYKSHAQEHQKITFGPAHSHAECLKAMASHVLATRTDDDGFNTPDWYRSAPADTRRTLMKRADDSDEGLRFYNAFSLSEAQMPSFAAYLHEQARKRLNQLLGRAGNDVDPDTVWAYSPTALIGTSTPAPISYTQLYRDGYADGIGFLEEKFSRSARFKGPEGVDLTPLSAEKVARSVTGVWIGQRYIDEVKSRLLNVGQPDYEMRRNATLALTQMQLRNAALECRLQGHIASLDLKWLERTISSMDQTSPEIRGEHAIHRLVIDGEWVIGCYLFSHDNHPTLLYTPNAPDGIGLREARLFNYLLKKLPGMLGYLLERVAVQSKARVRTFLEEARRQLPEDLDKTSSSPARHDPIRSQTQVQDLRRELYDLRLQRTIDDVQATTVNRTQMISGIFWTCVEWVAAIATAPFPVLSLSVGLALAFKDGMLALHAYHQGDNAQALEHFIGYLLNSAGGLFTDLRPALGTLQQFVRPAVRQAPRRIAQSPALKLIAPLEPTPAKPAGMQSVLFNGEFLWAPLTPDPIGRYLLYRLDPVTGKLVSTTRLAAPDAQGVWKRTGVTGGAPKYEKVPETPDSLKNYEMPAKYMDKVEHVLNPELKAQLRKQGDWVYDNPHVTLAIAAQDLQPVRQVYQQQVSQLRKDAEVFFSTPRAPAQRAALPPVTADTSLAALVGTPANTRAPNLIIGAEPSSIASQQVLIDNIEALAAKGYKRLYVEYLPGDVFRQKLAKLNNGKSWKHIERHLKVVDKAFGFAENGPFSYLALVRKASAKGLKIKALDASTSYHLEDALVLGDTPPTTAREPGLRNFYSSRVLEADSEALPDEPWIALVDPARMSTVNQKPGLADLHNAIAVRVEEVGPGQATGMRIDNLGATVADGKSADYVLAVQTHTTTADLPGPSTTTAPAAAGHYSDYDIAPQLRESIRVQSSEARRLSNIYEPTHEKYRKAHYAFKDAQKRLNEHAKQYLSSHTLPARPDLAPLSAQTQPVPFLQSVSESSLPGLVIGETKKAQSSKAFLIEHMQTLKDLKFDTLYIQRLLTDQHQADLDAFLNSRKMSTHLKDDIKKLDTYSGSHSYFEVIQKANKYGIRVRALDCNASYHAKDAGPEARNRMFSYFASHVISADQAANGPHKWVAFVDASHTNINRQIPGLADLQGTVSLNIRDSASSLSSNIRPGRWETSFAAEWTASRSDFTLEVGVTGTPPYDFVPLDRTRLKASGHFLVERPSMSETNLLHKSRTGEIVSTPIQVDDQGLFFIDRWGMKDQRFPHQDTLITAIRRNMELTPAP